METKKSNKIGEISRLQQILKKWRRLATSSKTSSSNSSSNSRSSSRSINFLKRTLSLYEREGASSNGVPKGYLAVCVGVELRRFIIPTEYLGHWAFHFLLKEAEEEFGFRQTGVLRIPCEVSVFERILKIVGGKKGKFSIQTCRLSVEGMMSYWSSSENQLSLPQNPMCR